MATSNTRIDPELLERVKRYLGALEAHRPPNGDEARAWREFYTHVDRLIRRFVRVLVSANDGVEDCTQEVWVKLVSRLARFEYDPSRGAFSSWLYRVVRDTTVSHFRREKRFRRSTRDRNRWDRSQAASLPDPGAAMDRDDAGSRATQMLLVIRRHVSRENYDLLRLRWLKERSVEQVADALHLSHEQVWYREHRARKKLRKVFAELVED